MPPLLAPELQRSDGELRLRFARRGEATRIADLYQRGCLKSRLPAAMGTEPPGAVLINTAGGLTDGDVLDVRVTLDPDAHAVVTTQAAERIYRCRATPARVDTAIDVGDAAFACWLPQETILFDGSRLARQTKITLAAGARLFAVESLVFGRRAMGEHVATGSLFDRWQVFHDDRLVFADALLLDDSRHGALHELLGHRAVADGHRCMATAICACPDPDALLGRLRSCLDASDTTGGASRVDSLVVMRLLAADSRQLRSTILDIYRIAAGDRDFRVPRVWHC